jgi:hypothetical protein
MEKNALRRGALGLFAFNETCPSSGKRCLITTLSADIKHPFPAEKPF